MHKGGARVLFEDIRVFIGSRSELAKFDWLSHSTFDALRARPMVETLNHFHWLALRARI